MPGFAQATGKPGGWVADFGDTKCSLSHVVRPEMGTIFRLEWGAGSEAPALLIGNPAWKKDLVGSEQAAVVILSPAGTRMPAKAFPLSGPTRRAYGLLINQLETSFIAALSSANGLAVEVGGQKLVEFALPQTANAVKTLLRCNDSLLQAMGVDPALMSSLRTRPKPIGGTVAQWVKANDYPMDALRRGASGTAIVRLTIGIDGRVKDCKIAATSGDVSLDRTTCSILQRRGRFEPAIGADGRPVDAPMVTSLRWWTSG